ncbi:MAG: DnaJ domain-containing protein [Bacteriovoracaceae bacterium]
MLKKIIYSTSGLILLGPIGAVTGFFIGNEADKANFINKWSNFYRLLGMIARCDGKINIHEISYLKYLTEDVLKCNLNNSLILLDNFKSGSGDLNLKIEVNEFHILEDFCSIDNKINYFEFKILSQIATNNNIDFKNSYLSELESHYNNLEVEPFSDYTSVKKAYHKLAQKFHPDSNPSSSATEKFISIQRSLTKIAEFCVEKN